GGFAALFACTGFEYVPVAAGETDSPQKNVPLALFFALLGSVLLYVLVQVVFMGTHPNPALADKPLAEAASAFAGPGVGRCLAVLVLRRTRPASSFMLRGGPVIPILATAGCLLFLNGIQQRDVVFSLGTLAVGLALHAMWRFRRVAGFAE